MTAELCPDARAAADDDATARRIGEAIRPETAREVLSRVEHRCSVCGATWPAGSVLWTGKQSWKAGRTWRTVYVCAFCPTPYEPVSKVTRDRLMEHVRRTAVFAAKARGGRPPVRFTQAERLIVAEIRRSGAGSKAQARAFRALTGRKIGEGVFRRLEVERQ